MKIRQSVSPVAACGWNRRAGGGTEDGQTDTTQLLVSLFPISRTPLKQKHAS